MSDGRVTMYDSQAIFIWPLRRKPRLTNPRKRFDGLMIYRNLYVYARVDEKQFSKLQLERQRM